MLERFVGRLAQCVLGNEQLDAPAGGAERAVLQRAEAGLAHHPLEQHAPSHADGEVQRFEFLVAALAVGRDQLGGSVRGFEVVREGDAAAGFRGLADRGQLLAAFL